TIVPIKIGDKITLQSICVGKYEKVKWVSNDNKPISNFKFKTSNGVSELPLLISNKSQLGIYKCIFSDKKGSVEQCFDITLKQAEVEEIIDEKLKDTKIEKPQEKPKEVSEVEVQPKKDEELVIEKPSVAVPVEKDAIKDDKKIKEESIVEPISTLQIKEAKTIVPIKVGDKTTLRSTCIGKYDKVTWLSNDNKPISSFKYKTSNGVSELPLFISNASQLGTYKCIFSDKKGSVEQSFDVTLKPIEVEEIVEEKIKDTEDKKLQEKPEEKIQEKPQEKNLKKSLKKRSKRNLKKKHKKSLKKNDKVKEKIIDEDKKIKEESVVEPPSSLQIKEAKTIIPIKIGDKTILKSTCIGKYEKVTWISNDNKPISNFKYKTLNGVSELPLVISNPSQLGTYKCIFSDKKGSVEQCFDITLKPAKVEEIVDEKVKDTELKKAEEKTKEKPQEKPQEKPKEKIQEKPQKKPQEKPKEMPEEKLQEKPQEKIQEKPKEKPKEKIQEKPQEKIQEEPQKKPQEKTQEKPKEEAQPKKDEQLVIEKPSDASSTEKSIDEDKKTKEKLVPEPSSLQVKESKTIVPIKIGDKTTLKSICIGKYEKVTWISNDNKPISSFKFKTSNGISELPLFISNPSQLGIYKCIFSDKKGNVEQCFDIT
uniref:Ig-like domain-containing protein n=1 Tax=Parastrongyloides trichosuri TaxID=131310 RepID=A0A0N4Z5N2_PARTI